jgi:hypothetical protein
MDYEHGAGWLLRGTIENPSETMHKTAPLPEEDTDRLLKDAAISNIRYFAGFYSHMPRYSLLHFGPPVLTNSFGMIESLKQTYVIFA